MHSSSGILMGLHGSVKMHSSPGVIIHASAKNHPVRLLYYSRKVRNGRLTLSSHIDVTDQYLTALSADRNLTSYRQDRDRTFYRGGWLIIPLRTLF